MANQTLADLRYVELKSDTALLDTRIYCLDIINVHHGDWIRDTLKPHLDLVEEFFGAVQFSTELRESSIRFETGSKIKYNPKPEIYAFLTEPQTEFLLTLSRNTKITVRKKAELIADFQVAKEFVRQQLQRQFESPATPQYPASNVNFCHTIHKVRAMSGIKSLSQVRKAIERDFIDGVDYAVVNQILCLNTETYLRLSTKFRSAEGVNLAMLPDKLDFATCRYFKAKTDAKKNSRVAKCSEGIQLKLDLNC